MQADGFRYCFTPLTGVLFTFPSRYWFTIGRRVVFSLGRRSFLIPAGFHVSRGTWEPDHRSRNPFHLQDCHLLRRTFPDASVTNPFSHFLKEPELSPIRPRNTDHTTLPGLTYVRFGLFPVRSPLLRKSLLFSFPGGTKMFQFSPFASASYVFRCGCPDITRDGFPHSEISGSESVWQLPEAYRSLPRLSSPPDAKASAVCP